MWPHEEISFERFGQQAKDLDKVRTEFNSFVYFDPNVLVVMVHGESQNAVSGAIKALESILCECVTRESSPVRLFLVDPPARNCKDHAVEMIRTNASKYPSRAFGLKSGNQKVARITTSLPLEQVESWEKHMAKFLRTNTKVLELAISGCLSRMRHYRGNVRMRSMIGTFVFQRYKWTPKEAKTQPTMDFIKNMREPSTEGTLHGA